MVYSVTKHARGRGRRMARDQLRRRRASRSRACARRPCARRCSSSRSRIRSARRALLATSCSSPRTSPKRSIAAIRDERFLILPTSRSATTWPSRRASTTAGSSGMRQLVAMHAVCDRPCARRPQSRNPIGARQRTRSGIPNASTSAPASPRTSLQSRLTSRVIALHRGPAEPAVLLEEAPVRLDRVQRVEVADQAQRRPCSASSSHASIAAANASSRIASDVRAGGVDGVVLDRAEHLERVVALVEAALEALGDRGRDVALAPAEQLELVLALEQIAVLVAAPGRRRRSPARSCARTAARRPSRRPARRRTSPAPRGSSSPKSSW